MKTRPKGNRPPCWALACGLALLALAATPLQAFEGMEDTVIITADFTDAEKWPRELQQWQQSIAAINQQVERTDQMIKLVGDPKQLVQQFVDSVPSLMKPIDDAIGLQTRQEALKTANSLYFLKSVAVKTYKDANAIGDTFHAFGQEVDRDPKRYAHFVLQEAMNARYKQAVAFAEAAEKAEAEVQKKALTSLKSATTQNEIELFNGLIAASRERLDLAHAKAAQAKSELDAFRGQLGFEDQQKAEADREWAQTVVDRMRQKALDAYNAQFDKASDTSS